MKIVHSLLHPFLLLWLLVTSEQEFLIYLDGLYELLSNIIVPSLAAGRSVREIAFVFLWWHEEVLSRRYRRSDVNLETGS